MFRGSWRLGRIAGVEIRIDPSWIFIALLITYSLYLRFREAFPQLEVALGWCERELSLDLSSG